MAALHQLRQFIIHALKNLLGNELDKLGDGVKRGAGVSCGFVPARS
ncbi:MAG: hypothetical protein ACR2PI_00630 [Hyphomicrobiaceae bacterium]